MSAAIDPPPRPLSPPALLLRRLVIGLARLIGMTMIDARDGRRLGRALFVPWRGKIHVIGLEAESSVKLQFLSQSRLTYWKQEIGFVAAPEPDFPHEPAPPTAASP